MSYDLAVVATPLPADDEAAWAALEAAHEKGGPVHPSLERLYDRLVTLYPCRSTIGEADVERSPWMTPVLRDEFDAEVATLPMTMSQGDVATRVIIAEAHALGLPVFDLFLHQIHRGDGFRGVTLTAERRHYLMAPRLDQVEAVVDGLTPDGGPGFFLLDRPNQDYMQAAGGKGHFTAEWREYQGESFKHWVAGYPGRRSNGTVAILTNGRHVPVRPNEDLAAADVKVIAKAFLEGTGRPDFYTWREHDDFRTASSLLH